MHVCVVWGYRVLLCAYRVVMVCVLCYRCVCVCVASVLCDLKIGLLDVCCSGRVCHRRRPVLSVG